MVALLLLSRDLADDAAMGKILQYWSAFIGFSKYTAFYVDAVFYVNYYLKSENRVLTLVVFVWSAELRPHVEICGSYSTNP